MTAALVEMEVLPIGYTKADFPPREELKRNALLEWRSGVKDSSDRQELLAFKEKYSRLAIFRELIDQRLE